MIITKVHPSLNELSGLSKNIGDFILAKLDSTVESLEAEKQKRLDKVNLRDSGNFCLSDGKILLSLAKRGEIKEFNQYLMIETCVNNKIHNSLD